MKPKFIQSDETRYENNEYANMPSVGYPLYGSARLTTKNQKRIDWELVKEIVKKYNLNYTIINDWAHQSEFVLYYKTSLDSDYIDYLRKSEQYEIVKKLTAVYDNIPQLLHDCVHELDEQTPLLFNTGWAGNVGKFGSRDVERTTYSFGDRLETWSYIEDKWSPTIHDTSIKLRKGAYYLMTSWRLKKD